VKSALLRLAAVAVLLVFAAPLATVAQPKPKVHRIGYLAPTVGTPLSDAFRGRLRALGYVEGHNLTIESRSSGAQFERLDSLAKELAALNVDVLVVWTPVGALAAKRATSRIPVVFLAAGDVVGAGLVTSLAHPGGNLTGVSFDATLETYAKGLEFLKQINPALTRVARMVATEPALPAGRQALYDGARALGLELHDVTPGRPCGSRIGLP
jgi:putative ABC transport system substrate-binding protein